MAFTSTRYVEVAPGGGFNVVWDGQVIWFPDQQSAERAFNDMAGLPNDPIVTGGGGGGSTGGSISDLLDALLGSNRERFDWEKAEAARQLYASLAQSLLSAASGLTGPRDWLRYQQYTAGGRNLMDQLYGSNPRPAFVAPSGTSEPLTLADILEQLGLGSAAPQAGIGQGFLPTGPITGAESTQRPVLGAQTPTSGAAAAAAGPAALGERATADRLEQPRPVPLPHQINPMLWDALSPTAREMIYGMLEAGQAQGGVWDPNDWLAQLNASRPRGIAPRRSQVSWAQPGGVY